MTAVHALSSGRLKQSIKDEASRLGFSLAGFTTPDPPPHLSRFEEWLAQGRHATMAYMSASGARSRRADPLEIMPACKTILVLATPYSNPDSAPRSKASTGTQLLGQIAAYAWGTDYHSVLPPRLERLVGFVEQQVGHPVGHRCYVDTGPILERDLAQRAGLGWIGKNTCLINPRTGSYFFLAEILLDLEIEPDSPFASDHCGRCTRCIDACPTDCILPDRTLDAGRCISYLTIELREEIPTDLRSRMGNWVFGCDMCQTVCPWNRFAPKHGDPAFEPQAGPPHPDLIQALRQTPEDFGREFSKSPVKRARRSGFLRNVAVALGNSGDETALRVLNEALQDSDPLVHEHAAWAVRQLEHRPRTNA